MNNLLALFIIALVAFIANLVCGYFTVKGFFKSTPKAAEGAFSAVGEVDVNDPNAFGKLAGGFFGGFLGAFKGTIGLQFVNMALGAVWIISGGLFVIGLLGQLLGAK